MSDGTTGAAARSRGVFLSRGVIYCISPLERPPAPEAQRHLYWPHQTLRKYYDHVVALIAITTPITAVRLL